MTKEQIEEINDDFNRFVHLYFALCKPHLTEEENIKLINWFNIPKIKLINLTSSQQMPVPSRK